MPIVQSTGTLQSFTNPPSTGFVQTVSAGGGWWPGLAAAYAQIFARQTNVRKCVEFLARNVAQLGLHAYRRVSDTDRQRLVDHDVILWMEKPNPATVRYQLIESLMADLGIYFNAYWLKMRSDEGGKRRVGLLRLPPEEIAVTGGLLPRVYHWYPWGGTPVEIVPGDLVVFCGFNPLTPLAGLSPLETLRSLLAEETAAQANRAAYWLNASRMEGIIERPATAPKWTREQKTDWREQWQAKFAGPQNAGMVAVLEDGMQWKPTSFSSKDSDYINSRKLSGEEVAAAYHIPLPMVGILDHATFSNIKEQHKQLYADTLGPWLTFIQEIIEAQLLPESPDQENVYFEFNIAEKLKGSFEEQSNALRLAVGTPFMTPNEARARLNLPSLDDPAADELAAQAGAPAGNPLVDPNNPNPTVDGEVVGRHVVRMLPRAAVEKVRSSWGRQWSRVKKLPPADRPAALQFERSNKELATDLMPFLGPYAEGYARYVNTETYALLEAGGDPFSDTREVPPCVIR